VATRNPFAAIARGHDLAEAIVDKTEGQLVFDLGDGQWNIPKLRSMAKKHGFAPSWDCSKSRPSPSHSFAYVAALLLIERR
jgi:hypothetical protein